MATLRVYSSSNEDGLLKSLGPYRIMTADKSFHGIKLAESTETDIVTIGEIRIYGQEITIGNESKSHLDLLKS